MRKYFLSLLLLTPLILCGQNLIPNPSFELFELAGVNQNNCGLSLADDWFTETFSTDYFNSAFNVFSDDSRGVPRNILGYQTPNSGDAYIGVYIYIPDHSLFANWAETAKVRLLSPLEADSFYQVSLYISKANESVSSIGDFGVLFASTTLGPGECAAGNPIPLLNTEEPHLRYQGAFLNDTLNWQQLCWTYQAKGWEEYITLGIFGAEENISFEQPGFNMYYYIDDVSVQPIAWELAQPLAQDSLLWCSSEAGTLSANGLHDSYLWNTGATGLSIPITSEGWYWVEAPLHDCTVIRDSIWVSAVAPEVLDLGPPELAVCAADLPLMLGTGSTIGGFSWSTGASSATIVATGAGVYTLSQAHPCGVFRDTLVLVLDDPPPLALAADSLLFLADFLPFELSATAGFASYEWNTGALGADVLIDAAGQYSLLADHACGAQEASFSLQLLAPPPLPANWDTVICADAELFFAAPLGYDSYLWSTGETSAAIVLTDTGTYELQAQHFCGNASSRIVVRRAPPLVIEFPDLSPIPLGESVTLAPTVLSGDPVSWVWTPAAGLSCANCADPSTQASQSMTYQVEITDAYGCSITDSIQLLVDNRQIAIYAPNAFSPNNDGLNDRFELYFGPSVAAIENWQVYDRWGGLVWAYDAGNNSNWNGQHGSQAAAQGLYVWRAQLRLFNDQLMEVSGEVLLVR